MSGISRTAKMFDVTTANSVIMPEPQRVPVEKVSFLAKHIFSTLITNFHLTIISCEYTRSRCFARKVISRAAGRLNNFQQR